jgi:hypothetical protein
MVKKNLVVKMDNTPPQAKVKTTIIVDFTENQIRKILLGYIEIHLGVSSPLEDELEILVSGNDYDHATFDGARFVREEN